MYLLTLFSYNTLCHLRLIYHLQLVLGDERDFSCKMSLVTKILSQRLVENTQFSSSDNHSSFKNSTLHICILNPHTCSLKHFSFMNKTTILSRCMRDKDPIVKAHERET
jgi:hypothetical protein